MRLILPGVFLQHPRNATFRDFFKPSMELYFFSGRASLPSRLKLCTQLKENFSRMLMSSKGFEPKKLHPASLESALHSTDVPTGNFSKRTTKGRSSVHGQRLTECVWNSAKTSFLLTEVLQKLV